MGFKDTVKKLDIFGQPKGLTIEGEETHKTYMGVVCAFGFLFSLIFASIYYLLQFNDRYDNPVIKAKGIYFENAPKLNLTELDFIFSITGYIGGNVVKPTELVKIVDVSISKGNKTTNTTENSVTTTFTSTSAVPCTEDHFVIREENLIAEPQFANLTLSVCRKITEDIILEGQNAESPVKKFVKISISPCTQDCRPDAQSMINEKGLRIVFGYNEASVKEKDFDYPFQHIYQTNLEFECYNTRQYKRKYFMEQTNVMTESGLLTITNRTNSVLNFKKEFIEDKKRETSQDEYVSLEFYSSHNGLNVTRSYITLSETLGLIGGVSSALTTAIGIIYGIYNALSLKIHLINKTILHSGSGKNIKLKAYHLPKIFLCKTANALNICDKCFSEDTKLKMTLFFSGNLRVYQYLDIKSIVQNIRDVKLFKKIFLNKEQTYMLNKIEQDTLLMEGATDYGKIMDEISDSEDEELVKEDKKENGDDKPAKRKTKVLTEKDVDEITRVFELFFKNANDKERLKDSVDIRLNNFLDEYILDILEIYKKDIEESSGGKLKFDYESMFDIKKYKYFKKQRSNLLVKYKAGLIKKGILNQRNMLRGVLEAALKFKRNLKGLRLNAAANKLKNQNKDKKDEERKEDEKKNELGEKNEEVKVENKEESINKKKEIINVGDEEENTPKKEEEKGKGVVFKEDEE